jgi:hypothetical protein
VSPKGSKVQQPRATPWGGDSNKKRSLKGCKNRIDPIRIFHHKRCCICHLRFNDLFYLISFIIMHGEVILTKKREFWVSHVEIDTSRFKKSKVAMSKKIHECLTPTPEEVYKIQARAEHEQLLIEQNEGIWGEPATDEEREEALKEERDRLVPVNCDEVKWPQYALVRLSEDPKLMENSEEYMKRYSPDLKHGKMYIMLGEILQQPGHAIIVDGETQKVVIGYHTARFEIIPPTEC